MNNTETVHDYIPIIQAAIMSGTMKAFMVLLELFSKSDAFDASLALAMAFGNPADKKALIRQEDSFRYWEAALRFNPEWGRVRRPDYGNPFFREIALYPNETFYSRFMDIIPPRNREELQILYNDVIREQEFNHTRRWIGPRRRILADLQKRMES